MTYKMKRGFTLIELIVVMAVIGILVLLAAPKFLGYTERARETKHIHTAKVIETALEAYLINGGTFPGDLEVIDRALLEEAAHKNTLIGTDGYVTRIDNETFYELTYDFIQKLDVKLSIRNKLLVEANASSVPTAVYASEKGIALVDKEKTMKGYELKPGDVPPEIVGSLKLIKIESGSNYTLALTDDGSVWGWGQNQYGEIGQSEKGIYSRPQKVKNLDAVVDISVGYKHSIALKSDGTVWGFGYNPYGQLGDQTKNNSSTPVKVIGLSDVKSVSAGEHFSMALKSDGTVWSWGYNNFGQLGDGTNSDSLIPVKARNLSNVKSITSGSNHSLALDINGIAWSWGRNTEKQLGHFRWEDKNYPVQVYNLSNIESIEALRTTSFAIKTDGTVWAWGYNNFGETGNGLGQTYQALPAQITRLSNIRSVHPGSTHAFAIDNLGKLFIWGSMSSNANKYPVEYKEILNVVTVSGGHSHAIAVNEDSEILVWGYNRYGQLGNGATEDFSTPTLITIP